MNCINQYISHSLWQIYSFVTISCSSYLLTRKYHAYLILSIQSIKRFFYILILHDMTFYKIWSRIIIIKKIMTLLKKEWQASKHVYYECAEISFISYNCWMNLMELPLSSLFVSFTFSPLIFSPFTLILLFSAPCLSLPSLFCHFLFIFSFFF